MSTKKLIMLIAGGLIIFGLGFWGGMTYQKKKTTTGKESFANGERPSMPDGTSGTKGNGNGTPPSGFGNGRNGGGMTEGEIISKSDTSLTIKTSDGSTKTVYFSDSTTISKNETGSSSDLAVGTKVSVSGTTNTDNSVTGKMIMIRSGEEPKE